MVQIKEFKGSLQAPDVADQINAFFQELAANSANVENLEILDIKYTTNIMSYRTGEGPVKNAIVSSALVFFNA